LAGIYGYIANHNPPAAKKLNQLLRQRFAELSNNPLMGELRGDLEDLIPGVRSVSVGWYVIYFRPKLGGVEIARVLHGARDPRSVIEG
jgi:toxin ParE1/3/4